MINLEAIAELPVKPHLGLESEDPKREKGGAQALTNSKPFGPFSHRALVLEEVRRSHGGYDSREQNIFQPALQKTDDESLALNQS
jgi:hypothetical protein